ncbi:GNAT family N-acetyltransferase [Enterococcus sp. DIV0170]|uniref:GNAT family N-acetyltransferase n=1 Tax=Enterococcus sp. DIV0170 TaxID=2774642 RepID=UPI003F289855
MGTIKQINRKKKNELANLLLIWESSVAATHHFLTAEDIQSLKPEVKNALLMIDQLYGYYDPTLVGFVGIENEKVEMLFVAAHFRGNRIGKKLLQYAIDEQQIKYVDVNEQNDQGIGFYQHMGFQLAGRSEFDEQGNAFPILHLKIRNTKENSNEN